MNDIRIRTVRPEDLDQVAAVEGCLFSRCGGSGREKSAGADPGVPESFLVAEWAGRVIGFINGAVTDQKTISDDMFEDVNLHNPEGAYQSIFRAGCGGGIPPSGHSGAADGGDDPPGHGAGAQGADLTCKDRLIGYYQKFGYVNQGVSASVHGGAVWYDMILEFKA